MNWYRNYFSDKALITILKSLPLCMNLQELIIDMIKFSMMDDELDFLMYTEYDISEEEKEFQDNYRNRYLYCYFDDAQND